MIKFCEQCGTFFDDEFLRFCLNDGMPLVDIKEENGLWNKGKSSIANQKILLKREIRKQYLKKIISMLITTTLIIMVISIVTLNAWIYLSEPEKELVKDDKPKPTQEKIVIPDIGFESTPTPTPTPTPKPTATKTPTPTPSPTISPPPPDLCPKAKQIEAEKRIESQYAKSWRELFLNDKATALQRHKPQIMQICQKKNPAINCEVLWQRTEINLSEKPTAKTFKTDKLCKNVTAKIAFTWTLILPNSYGSVPFTQTKNFNYPFN